MESIHAWFSGKVTRITGSIAFLPGLITLGFIVFAMVLRSIGQAILGPIVGNVAPFLLIGDADVALNLLTMITGGLISLMVFSFSMVMVLLSNATSNLSPRLLPSLIGSKNHQIVLGLYLGTIIFNIIVAMDFGLKDLKGDFPSVAVAIAVLLGIVCLALFVYFIHNVSRSIQVGVVLDDVYGRTIKTIEGIVDRNGGEIHNPPQGHAYFPAYAAEVSGFFQGVDGDALSTFAKRKGAVVYVDKLRGKHVLKGDHILTCLASSDIDDLFDGFHEFMRYESTELTSRYYAHGITRIVEVALKALSPGINDPGTALTSIDYLTDIFDRAIAVGNWEAVSDDEGIVRVWLRMEKWESLLYRHVLSVHTYGKSDYAVCQRLADMLIALKGRIKASDSDIHDVIVELLSIVNSEKPEVLSDGNR